MGGFLVVKKRLSLIFISLLIVVLAACGDDGGDNSSVEGIDKIIFADAGWDSMRVHNTIAQTIIEKGYGYDTDVISGSTATTFQGLRTADINAYMEAWTDNIKEVYEEALEEGDVVEFLSNYETSAELTEAALLYMIENDVDHIEAALWWLEEYEDVWTEWVSEDIAEAVKESL